MKAQAVAGGWLTAESMLPTQPRPGCDISRGNLMAARNPTSDRSCPQGRDRIEETRSRTVWVDCDVLQADGGTRTASITGGCVALAIALNRLIENGRLTDFPLTQLVSAVSAGVCNGLPILDLNYPEDRDASVDFNVVMTEDGNFVELQGSGERAFSPQRNAGDARTFSNGIENLVALQREAILAAGQNSAHLYPIWVLP